MRARGLREGRESGQALILALGGALALLVILAANLVWIATEPHSDPETLRFQNRLTQTIYRDYRC